MLIAGWIPCLLLSPVQGVVPMPIAAAIQYVKAVSIMIAFFAAVAILLDGPRTDGSGPDAAPGF